MLRTIWNTLTGAHRRWQKTVVDGIDDFNDRLIALSGPPSQLCNAIGQGAYQFIYITLGPERASVSPFLTKYSQVSPRAFRRLFVAVFDAYSALHNLRTTGRHAHILESAPSLIGFDANEMHLFQLSRIDPESALNDLCRSLYCSMREILNEGSAYNDLRWIVDVVKMQQLLLAVDQAMIQEDTRSLR